MVFKKIMNIYYILKLLELSNFFIYVLNNFSFENFQKVNVTAILFLFIHTIYAVML